jgi:hypothetical protein
MVEEREFWLTIRRALLIVLDALERKLSINQPYHSGACWMQRVAELLASVRSKSVYGT